MCVDKMKVSTLLVISLLIVRFTVVLIILCLFVANMAAAEGKGSSQMARIVIPDIKAQVNIPHVLNIHIAYDESDRLSSCRNVLY